MRLLDVVHDRVLDLEDAEGRFLGESHADTLRPLDPVACPLEGERRGRRTHMAPWRQAAAHLDAVLDLLQAASGPTAAHAWRATCRLRWGPTWGPRPVPVLDSVGHKTALGLERPLSSWLLLAPGAAAGPLEALVPVDEVVQRLETEGWLLGARSVCPAPPKVLERAWAALTSETEPEPHPADVAARWISGLWAVLGATRRLLRDGCDDLDGDHVVRALLDAGGPGALVREVPRFEPAWALHVWEATPAGLGELVEEARRAERLAELDAAWARYLMVVGG